MCAGTIGEVWRRELTDENRELRPAVCSRLLDSILTASAVNSRPSDDS